MPVTVCVEITVQSGECSTWCVGNITVSGPTRGWGGCRRSIPAGFFNQITATTTAATPTNTASTTHSDKLHPGARPRVCQLQFASVARRAMAVPQWMLRSLTVQVSQWRTEVDYSLYYSAPDTRCGHKLCSVGMCLRDQSEYFAVESASEMQALVERTTLEFWRS